MTNKIVGTTLAILSTNDLIGKILTKNLSLIKNVHHIVIGLISWKVHVTICVQSVVIGNQIICVEYMHVQEVLTQNDN